MTLTIPDKKETTAPHVQHPEPTLGKWVLDAELPSNTAISSTLLMEYSLSDLKIIMQEANDWSVHHGEAQLGIAASKLKREAICEYNRRIQNLMSSHK